MKKFYCGVIFRIAYFSEDVLNTSSGSVRFIDEKKDNEYKDIF